VTTGGGQRTSEGQVEIPVIDAPGGPLQLAEMTAGRLPSLLDLVHETLSPRFMALSDKLSRAWLHRSVSPYQHEIDSVARLLPMPGAYVLNLSVEWACTSGCYQRSDSAGMTLYRTLDWPLRLGGAVIVGRHQTELGPYLNVTWPGFIGLLTALAPQRFAAAINQGPMTYSFGRFGLGLPIDWCVNRIRIWRQRALPATHLLRQVFETCATYEEARDRLLTTPISAPVFFTLTGAKPGQGCIIERRESDGILHEGSGATGNHWLTTKYHGRPRPIRSHDRQQKLLEMLPQIKGGLDWVEPPVLNDLTRLACEMNAGTGRLVVQGWHGPVPQTRILSFQPGAQALPS
jgi:hypothetical protein